jgi:ribosomal protein S18 acetylase RimI-like enzyme
MPSIAVPLTASHIPHAAMIFARAFQNDPFYTCALPDPARRARVLPWLQERLLRYGLRYGAVYTTPSLEGVAIWLGPQHPTIRVLGALQTGLFLLPMHLSLPEFRRSLRLSNYADRLHAASIAGPHLYLLQIGVEPSLQGQGIGWALTRQGLQQADRQALPCYLDTYNEGNIPSYERNGFTIVGHGQASPASAPIWGLLRKPGIVA